MTKALILAIEPDARQAGQLQAIARRLSADMQLVKSTERALATFDKGVPDLILTPALLSRRDELALTERLRSLGDVGAHIQTLTIPILETSEAPSRGSGMLSALRRDKARAASPAACEVDTFAEQVSIYLERAVTIRRVRELGAAAAAGAETPRSVEAPEPDAPAPDQQLPVETSAADDMIAQYGEPAPVLVPADYATVRPQASLAGGLAIPDSPAPIAPPDAVATPRQLERVKVEALASPALIAPPDAPAPLRQVERVKLENMPPPAPIAPPDAPAPSRQVERVRLALPSPQPVLEGPEPDFLMTIRQLKSTLTASVRDAHAQAAVPESEPEPHIRSLVEPELPVPEHGPDSVTMTGFDAAPDALSAYLAEAAAFSAETDAEELAPVAPLDTAGDADEIGALGEFAAEQDVKAEDESRSLPSVLVSGPHDSTIAVSDLASLFASEDPPPDRPSHKAKPAEQPRAEPSSVPARAAAPPASDGASKPRKKGGHGDEWRYFDPKQFRFAALIAKLDEITAEKRG